MSRKTLLVITDGIGYNPEKKFNAFYNATKPTYDWLFMNTPYSFIKTYGASVGLPDGQMGNSEVGHMTIGSGRILYQDLVKINLAIKNDTFKENKVLQDTLAQSNNVHIVGLLSDGGVHSHIDHIKALAHIGVKNHKVYLHLITDGRDVSPTSAKNYLQEVLSFCNESIIVATIGGRYYGMDRDNNWDRVQKGYDVMIGDGTDTTLDPLAFIDSQYELGIFDEFITPTRFNRFQGIESKDALIFANFRSDRARELSCVFASEMFDYFPRKPLTLFLATMTEYDKNLPIPVLFPKENPRNTLCEVIASHNLTQLHTAETEKYAHVTFFLNGGKEDLLLNEKRILIPSPKVATYDLKPAMSAPQVSKVVQDGIKNGEDFIVVNFANGDMVGHTGVYEAGIAAVEAVDKELGAILHEATNHGYNIVITSDHGNCEMMQDENGNPLTNHTVGDVYCFVIAPHVTQINNGGLSNIAPTILKLMELPIPQEMDLPLF